MVEKSKPDMWERSRELYRNRAHQGAYRKGARGFWHQKGREDNPYMNRQTAAGVPTWSAGYYWAWSVGFSDAANGRIART